MSEKLSKVLDLLIAEDRDEAAKALNEWFAEQQASVTAKLMESDEAEEDLDESITITIDDDSDAEVADGAIVDESAEKPEYFDVAKDWLEEYIAGEAEELEPGASYEMILEVVRQHVEFTAEEGGYDHLESEQKAEAVINDPEVLQLIKQAAGGVTEDDEEPIADETGDEAGDEFVGDDSAVEDLTVDERVEDLEAQLEALRAEFAALMGDEADEDGEEAEIVDGDSEEEETEGDDEVEEAIAPGVPGKKTTFSQKSGIDFGGNQKIREDEEEFDDLAESADYHLEPVAAEKLKTEGETTGVGKKVKVQKDSPIPQRKPDERAGGDPVEIKGKTHKGYAREAAPTVVGGNEKFKNSVKAPKKISKEGDKSAELNKGPKEDKGKSPISGDPKLRGRDLSRK
ncbi:hypothetical protein D3C72_394050 [compost metagenome]